VYVKRLNVGRLSEERLGEAEKELKVAEAFLADGLLRNAPFRLPPPRGARAPGGRAALREGPAAGCGKAPV